MLLFLVEEHLSRDILERITDIGEFDTKPGTGIAFQIDVEDAVGVLTQERTLHQRVEEEL
jgi:predicted Rdx family selenoprotein